MENIGDVFYEYGGGLYANLTNRCPDRCEFCIRYMVGALGGAITGSGTNSNVLFGKLQVNAAAAIGASPTLLAAANIMGAGIGKMICPQSIAIGAAAAGIAGAESRLFKAAFPWFAAVVLTASVLTGLAALCNF